MTGAESDLCVVEGRGSFTEAKERPENPYEVFSLRGALALWKFYVLGARAGCESLGRPLWPVFHVVAWRYLVFVCRWWWTDSVKLAAKTTFPDRWRSR